MTANNKFTFVPKRWYFISVIVFIVVQQILFHRHAQHHLQLPQQQQQQHQQFFGTLIKSDFVTHGNNSPNKTFVSKHSRRKIKNVKNITVTRQVINTTTNSILFQNNYAFKNNNNIIMNFHFRNIDKPKPTIRFPSKKYLSNFTLHKANKPIFILHVGPPKTATTALQYHLSQYKRTLQQYDNFTYVGRFQGSINYIGTEYALAQGFTRRCAKKLMDMNNGDTTTITAIPKCWNQTLQQLKSLHGQNVIFSEENLASKETPVELIKSTLSPHWHVQIVVGYRRFFEWIISAKNQAERPTPNQLLRNRWQCHGGIPTMPHFPYITQVINETRAMPLWYTDGIINRYEAYFDDIVIWNMHAYDNNTDPVIGFLCDVLPSANATCKAATTTSQQQQQQQQKQQHYKQQSFANPSIPLDYDMLVFDAANQGLLNVSLSRPIMANAAKSYHQLTLNQSVHDFPLKCPTNNDLWLLYRLTSQFEYALVPEFYTSSPMGGKAAIETAIQNANQMKKFCWIDTNQTLQDLKWQQFFKNYL